MTFEKLYSLCGNLTMYTRLFIMEDGHNPVNSKLEDVYYDISEREIKWFSFQDGLFVLKLEKKGE